MKDHLGLIVDVPKSSGSGTRNDGNTARKVFRNYKVSAEIIGIDQNLMKLFYVILCFLSCKHQINADELERYTKKTAELYVSLYPWFPMLQSVHKRLIHSSQVVRDKLVGLLSEEAHES